MSETITVIPRSINIITTEIKIITKQTQQIVLANAKEIGRRLLEAKSMVPHGEWGKYLREELEYSQSSANNFMKIYEEYGSNQQSLFGSGNSQALENLTYTKALLLLALPAEDRETFAEENNVEELSTRELARVIRERDAAQEENVRNLEVLEAARKEIDQVAAAAAEQEVLVSALKDRAEAAEKQAAKVDKLKADLSNAVAAQRDAEEKLKRAMDHPEVPDATMEALRREAEAAAAKQAADKVQAQLAAAEKKAQEAEEAKIQAEQKLDAAQKASQLANPDAAVFKTLFEQVQADFNKLTGALLKVRLNDPDLGKKFTKAVETMLENMDLAVGQSDT